MKEEDYFDLDLTPETALPDGPLPGIASSLTVPPQEAGLSGSPTPEVKPEMKPEMKPEKKPMEFYGHGWKTWCGIILAGTLLFAYAMWPDAPAKPTRKGQLTPTGTTALPPGPAMPPPHAIPEPAISTLKQEMATIMTAQQQYSGKNREAISLLARRIDAQDQHIALLTARLAAQDARLTTQVSAPPPTRPAKQASPPRTSRAHGATTGWRVSSIYPGMAWLEHDGRTWAVAAGDTLKGLHITAIDAEKREVITAEGIIKD